MEHTIGLDPSPGVGLFMPDLWAAMGGEDAEVLGNAQCHQRLMAATGLPARGRLPPMGVVRCPCPVP